jgi:hypothetical protein
MKTRLSWKAYFRRKLVGFWGLILMVADMLVKLSISKSLGQITHTAAWRDVTLQPTSNEV